MGWVAVGCVLWATACHSLTKQEGNNQESVTSGKPVRHGFSRPVPPQAIVDPQKRVSWLVEHYWDTYDFRDTTLIADPEIAEQAFVDFIVLLPRVEKTAADHALSRMVDSTAAMMRVFEYFTDLSEKYFYDPNSPYRSDDAYIAVLKAILKAPVDSLYKIRPEYQLQMLLKNRPGEVAADFRYVGTDGKQGRLSAIKADYTLVFFHDPECPECNRVKEYMELNPVFGEAAASSKLMVLGLYLDENIDAWKKEPHPAFMLNARDMNQEITKKALYDIRAIPTLYLLDRQKRVILRDITIEHLGRYLSAELQ